MRLFLDMDGVLADFDKKAAEVLGMTPSLFEELHGQKEFWARLYAVPDFFYTFDPIENVDHLLWACMKFHPTVLTGLPYGEWAADQKRRWIREKLPQQFQHMPVITCYAKQKAMYCQPGDILIDDREKNSIRWTEAGGRFIHFKDPVQAVNELVGSP